MSRSAPKRRREKRRENVHPGDEVVVHKTSGDDVLGVVRNVLNVHGHVNVCVRTGGADVVTQRNRVEPVAGVKAKEARQLVERGDND